MKSDFSKFPSMDNLLKELQSYDQQIDLRFIKVILNDIINDIKRYPTRYQLDDKTRDALQNLILEQAVYRIRFFLDPTFLRVINASGVILHTGLGRAPLGSEALQDLLHLSEYTNLEFDLPSGKRGERLDHVVPLLKLLTGADSGIVVNNNAAAVLLILHAIARRKEVIVSRGELVEIGGSFRLPEVMKNSGAKMIEIGSTNKTHLYDYEEAITEKTAAIMIVHPSNYKIIGFTDKPQATDILSLAHEHGIPVIFDLGSGALIDMQRFGLQYEPVVSDMIEQGFDIISFSGDKLLGGPQAGIIVGKEIYIQKIKRDQLLRAVRCDKIILSSLAETLRHYLHPQSIVQKNQTLRLFNRSLSDTQKMAKQLVSLIAESYQTLIKIVQTEGRAGSGAYPVTPIPSMAIQVHHPKMKSSKLARLLRQQDPPIIGMISDDVLYINLLTVNDADLPIIADKLNQLL